MWTKTQSQSYEDDLSYSLCGFNHWRLLQLVQVIRFNAVFVGARVLSIGVNLRPKPLLNKIFVGWARRRKVFSSLNLAQIRLAHLSVWWAIPECVIIDYCQSFSRELPTLQRFSLKLTPMDNIVPFGVGGVQLRIAIEVPDIEPTDIKRIVGVDVETRYERCSST